MADKEALAELFLSALEEAKRDEIRRLPDLASILAERFEAAESAWPQLKLPRDVFCAYLAERAPSVASQLERALRNWRTEDLYLCCACLAGYAAAEGELQRRSVAVIETALRRLRLRGTLAEDVRQQLLDQLLVGDEVEPPMIARYAGLGALDGWLRVVAARTGRRALERERRLVPVGDDELAKLADDGHHPELAQIKSKYRAAFKRAFKSALAELEPDDLRLLRHRHADGLRLQEIGAIYRVHHSTIHRRLERVRALLSERTRELLGARLAIAEDECASIIRMISTSFDITLQTFLGEKEKHG